MPISSPECACIFMKDGTTKGYPFPNKNSALGCHEMRRNPEENAQVYFSRSTVPPLSSRRRPHCCWRCPARPAQWTSGRSGCHSRCWWVLACGFPVKKKKKKKTKLCSTKFNRVFCFVFFFLFLENFATQILCTWNLRCFSAIRFAPTGGYSDQLKTDLKPDFAVTGRARRK